MKGNKTQAPRPSMKRRGLLAALAAATAAVLIPKGSHASKKRVRPPGALLPGDFEKACIGCFRCAEVCPVKAIEFTGALQLDSATPYVNPRERACTLCMKCTEVCPTDALVPIEAKAEVIFKEVHMGIPVLDRKACLTWNGSGVCRLCYYACPYADRAVELVGPQQAPLFHRDACVGCGLCEEACPELAHAIRIAPLGEDR